MRYFYHSASSSDTIADSDLSSPQIVVDGQGAVQYEGRINRVSGSGSVE